jgi:dTDP-4-amino-4,6-dideoxygalactose transaminase
MTISDIPAILGGKPIFDKPYHLVRPILPRFSDIIKGLEDLYESRILTNQGVFVRTLEARIAREINVKHCALFCNATIAIMCLVKALGLSGKVLVPSFTFAATTQALLWQNLQCQFVDISQDSFTMDPGKIEEAITDDTAAIFPVNIFGTCCEHDTICEIARRAEIPLIYDSAQAFGSKYKGRPVGSLGNAEVFSFHATKIFHTGEGGAVTTNSSQLYQKLCKIRNFGFEGYLNCTELGINGKMSEFSALIGLNLLDQLPSHISKRHWVFQHYKDSLKHIDGIIFAKENKDIDLNYSYFNIIIDPERFGLTNIELNYSLIAENIVTRLYFYPPVHRTSYYKSLFDSNPPHLPQTDWAAAHLLCLPVYSDMQTSELAMIIEGIIRCQKYANEIKKKLSGKVPSNWEFMSDRTFLDPHDIFILSKENTPD